MKKSALLSFILLACPIIGHATTYTYDKLDRLTSAVESNGDYINYSYDAGGNVTVIDSSARNGHEAHNGSNSTGQNNTPGNKPASVTTQVATHTSKTDSDQDGIPDTWEITHGTNPHVTDSSTDSDKNGYTNLQEYKAQANARLDTDHDGMFDKDEIRYKTNPKNSSDCPAWYCQGFSR